MYLISKYVVALLLKLQNHGMLPNVLKTEHQCHVTYHLAPPVPCGLATAAATATPKHTTTAAPQHTTPTTPMPFTYTLALGARRRQRRRRQRQRHWRRRHRQFTKDYNPRPLSEVLQHLKTLLIKGSRSPLEGPPVPSLKRREQPVLIERTKQRQNCETKGKEHEDNIKTTHH